MSNKFKGTKRAKGERATDSNILTFIVPEVDGTSRKEVGRNGSGSEYSNVHNNDTRSGLQFAKGAGGQSVQYPFSKTGWKGDTGMYAATVGTDSERRENGSWVFVGFTGSLRGASRLGAESE
ncbi:hypothetical protein AXG93_815s1580 [Marchantia polymorpha subsp. ruderalis]|uniref:Uncharacterized protein n=1 Tax=Marchantia polymorpha subsp. ruderalis TaxID=1480154 RepID=A0A176W1Y0_MARPO|nr:hypothetical protein AXG93_815s1580 [Marchantia polymorpha subsp. ruderalis]